MIKKMRLISTIHDEIEREKKRKVSTKKTLKVPRLGTRPRNLHFFLSA
jgi:hypothetical protein